MATNNDDIKWLYGKFKAKGYNIGTEQEFASSLANDEDRQWYFEKAKGMGLNIGSMDDFNSLYAPQPAEVSWQQPMQQLPMQQQPTTPMQQAMALPYSAAGASDAAAPEQEPAQPAPQQSASPQEPWQPTTQERIRRSHQMHTMLEDFNQRSRARIEQADRMAEPLTAEGRKKRRAMEFQAQMAGTPTKVPGLTRPAAAPATDGAQDGAEAPQAVQSMQSPVPYGVKYVDGKPVTQWQLPDGSLTTSLMEADQAEYGARHARMAHEADKERGKKMREMGLNPAIQSDTELYEQYLEQERLEQALTKRKQELDAEYDNVGIGTKILRSLANVSHSGKDPMSGRETAEARNYASDKTYNMLMSAIRNNRASINILENKHRGAMNEFWVSAGKELVNGYTFSGGKSELDDARALNEAAALADEINRKRRNNEALTEDEQTAEILLRNLAMRNYTEGQYGGEYGAWARAGKMGAHSLELLPEFAIGGTSIMQGAAGKIIGKMGLKAATSVLKRRALKATGVALGSLVGGAAMTNTIQAPRLMASTSKRMTGEVSVDENGDYIIDGKEGFVTSLLKAERELIAENASEAVGAFIPGMGKVIDKLGLSKLSGSLARLRGTGWYKATNEALRRMGFNGTLNEGLEEYTGNAYSTLMGDTDALRSMGDLDTHVDIWLGTLTFGGILNVPQYIGTGIYGVQYARQKRRLRHCSNLGNSVFGERWEQIADDLDNCPNEQMAAKVAGMLRSEVKTDDEKRALLDYAAQLQKMRGFNLGTMSAMEGDDDGDISPERREVDKQVAQSYEEGAAIADRFAYGYVESSAEAADGKGARD